MKTLRDQWLWQELQLCFHTLFVRHQDHYRQLYPLQLGDEQPNLVAYPHPLGKTMVLKAKAMSISPEKEMPPNPPLYGPRLVTSSSSINSMAFTYFTAITMERS
nr:anthranilate synthase [Ipomoea batatas]